MNSQRINENQLNNHEINKNESKVDIKQESCYSHPHETSSTITRNVNTNNNQFGKDNVRMVIVYDKDENGKSVQSIRNIVKHTK